ncbi:gamma-parvin isoform X4 [Marmota flaviventris]|uniref:gamma-parvin isoform X4 n=1 Tax=Marmota flaviventris TaxID=93162 RepID=UPI003A85C4A9
MEPESLYNLLQLPSEVALPTEEQLPQGAKKKYLPPSSRKDPKFEELQKVLVEWINAALLPEHVVVRSLEEDMFDGLILHHLLPIFNKDLVATLHLLVALAKHFQPSVPLPSNVQVEVVTIESTKSGLKSGKSLEQLTTQRSTGEDQPSEDVLDELLKMAPEKVRAVEEAIVSFVNHSLRSLGLAVQSLNSQFADGVILLLLIGQLEGFFLHLKEFYLTPSSPAEMVSLPEVHNVTLALELLRDAGLLSHPVSPEDIVNKDPKSTLRVLYSLFCKHKLKASADGTPCGTLH